MTTREVAAALLLALGGLLLATASALAGTAGVVTKYHADPTGEGCSKYAMCEYREVEFVAAPGEANVVSVSFVVTSSGAANTVIRDAGAPVDPGAPVTSGAPLTPGADCTSVDDHTVSCPPFPATVRAGDMDDSVTGGFILRGGPGDDRLTGGAGNELLDGEEGNDTLDGGAGFDSVDYSARDDAVVVDLSRADPTGGVSGESDALLGIEAVYGGSAADVLLGSGRADTLWGGAGADRISGRGGRDGLDGDDGRDRIRGGRGRDSLSGNAGRDTLLARDGRRDRVWGGRGRDRGRVDRRLDRIRSVSVLF